MGKRPKPPPTGTTPNNNALSLDPFYWDILYSQNVPPRPAAPWHFSFPTSGGGIDYVVTPFTTPILGKKITMDFEITGLGHIKATEQDSPAQVRLFMQHKSSSTEDNRWWSNPLSVQLIAPQVAQLQVTVAPDQWSQVYGKKGTDRLSQFNDCVANLGKIGFTFGGYFFGHGVIADQGQPIFYLKRFTVS